MEQKPDNERSSPAPDEPVPSPRHGFQGDRGISARPRTVPAGLTIAVSREAGARGGTVGRRVGRLLGWQVYDQELLEYVAQEATVRQDLLDHQPPPAARWCAERLEALMRQLDLGRQPTILNLARLVLELGAQ